MRRFLLFAAAVVGCSGAPGATPAGPRPIFEDRFDGHPGDGWSWLRENPAAWRVRDGALEIRVEPGKAENSKNVLVRTAPDRREGPFVVEVTVTNTVAPTNQYEQAGITWYCGGKPVFKFVKERVDGRACVVPGKIPIDSATVQLRLTVTADAFTAQYRPDAQGDWLTAQSGKLLPPADDQVSLQCYQGPPDAEHWIRFDDFRIKKKTE